MALMVSMMSLAMLPGDNDSRLEVLLGVDFGRTDLRVTKDHRCRLDAFQLA
jgi:hypothetical protein